MTRTTSLMKTFNLSTHADILPRGILLAPIEMGRNVTRTPQIIGMRGANEDDEDSESLVEDSKEGRRRPLRLVASEGRRRISLPWGCD